MAAPAPSAEELEAKKGELHSAPPPPPKSGVDPTVLAIYQATFDRDFPAGGMALVCQTLGLDVEKYPKYLDCTSRDMFTEMSLGAV
mmetsp:Transcript_13855/g.25955  ORF Transcript_13855/g.25955 Transcript_13855/m.25955 type:complete len:86 (+) Transcript_13855:60-317(+)